MNDRKSYYAPTLDPASDLYEEAESDMAVWPDRGRVEDDSERANVWSSETGTEGMHLPCFDVDVPLTEAVKGAIGELFGEVTYVPSSTPGHHHAYSYECIPWDLYQEHLNQLTVLGIVEVGYLGATRERGATFVRMPHVKKRMLPT